MKELLEELLQRIEALEDRVRLLEYQLAPEERQEPEQESGWYPCAHDCGAQVREESALCEACQACEELGFTTIPTFDPARVPASDRWLVDEQCDSEEQPDEEARLEAMSQHWQERRAIESDYVERPW